MRGRSTIKLLLVPLLLLFSSTALMVREHSASVSEERQVVIPKSGCWGSCGGKRAAGPLSMTVSSGRVLRFVFAEKCLGESVLENVAHTNSIVLPADSSRSLPINGGRFSFQGKTQISIDSAPPGEGVLVGLAAKFSSATTASGTLTVEHPGCERVHFTTHYRAR